MNLTAKEVELINRSERTLFQSRVSSVLLILMLLVAFGFFYEGYIGPDPFAALCVGLTILAILLPHIRGPKYADIVALLVKVRAEASVAQQDPLVAALEKK